MSFSRAPLKRFNESVGCAPPPGIYDIRSEEPKGAASFDKSDRFKKSKAVNSLSPSRIALMSPVRRTLSVDGLVEGSSAKKDKNAMTLERKQQRLLEKEIRSLVQQRGEQDRRLQSLEEDLKKVEAKLLAAVREKTGLTANITTLERQKAELKKVNDFLKNKVSADTTKKRINSLTMELMEARNNLDSKNEELSVLQLTSEGRVKVMETNLKANKDTLQALKDRNKDLEEIHHVTKTQNEELEQENTRLHAEIRELKEEVRVIQGYLDTSNDQIQDLRLKLQGTTQQALQLQNIEHLQQELEQCSKKLESAELLLREKEEEALKYQRNLQASRESLLEAESKLESQELSSQKLDAELARLRVVLRRTESELDERVEHLEQRCLISAEEISRTQEEGFRRVEELKTELYLLKETDREEKSRQIRLQSEHASLTEELAKERALVDSLSVLLEHERQESEEHRSKLKEELEEVLGELALIEEQEQRRSDAMDQSQEALQKLQEENTELERQLSDTRELLDRKNSDVSSLKEEHSVAMTNLQEVHTNLLNNLGAQATELERTKEALRAMEERRKHLEEEIENRTQLTKQIKEELDNVIQQKDEEIMSKREELEEHQRKQFEEQTVKEENARVLLEMQALLTHRHEQMQAMEVSHSARVSQLEQELQHLTKDKEEVLRQVEEQTSQEVAELRHEKEIAQKQLDEVHQEKVDIKEQLLQEKEEKVKYQAALQAACVAREAETKEHQQLRSGVLRLQTELEKMDEERRRLVSQVELSNQSELALKHHMETVEKDRNHIQACLDELQLKDVNLEAQLALMEEKMETLQCEVDHHHQDQHALQQQVKELTEEKVTLQWEIHQQGQELQRQIAEAQENSSSTSETERWRTQYEELFAKVKPFQEQLNSFAAERNALLNENGANQEELNRLADAYARLLGHQNQKQKIKHVMKLKDENMNLKQEVLKLRSQVSRQKSDLDKLKSKLPGGCERRFDPSKAFQHNKENRHTEMVAPLREENRTLERL